MAKVIAVDFDGTLCECKYPDIGAPVTPVIEYVKERKAAGDIVILWTCRGGGSGRNCGRVVQTARIDV